MNLGVLTLDLSLPGCDNLKEKRHRLRGVIERTRGKFNVSAAEIGLLDHHRDSIVAIAMISNDRVLIEKVFTIVEELFASGDGLIITGNKIEWL